MTNDINDITLPVSGSSQRTRRPKNAAQGQGKSVLLDKNEASVSQREKISLPPIEFFCQYHYVIDEITEKLSTKFGPKLTAPDFRKKVEAEARNDVLEVLRENKCYPVQEYESEYLRLIFADILGLGLFEQLLSEKDIDEIMVVNYDLVYVEKGGIVQLSDVKFPTMENALSKVKRIITPLNKTIDTSHPNVDAQLPDGSRLSATIPPLRANGAISIDIRKFKDKVEPLLFYSQHYHSSTPEMVQFIEAIVKGRISMIVSGGTGSGKTTTLNSCSICIPETERVITIEDTLELQLQQKNWESYQTVERNVEGKGGFTTQDIVKMALRKRPDRIIVGECRGGELVEMLNAMNTGHDGSMSTIHANTPKDMITRAHTMILSNPDTKNLGDAAIYQMIDSALDIIVQVARLADGSRKIMNITEIVGYGEEGCNKLKERGLLSEKAKPTETLYLQNIFQFRQTSTVEENGREVVHGQFVATGYIPYCVEKLREKGFNIPDEFFKKRVLMEV